MTNSTLGRLAGAIVILAGLTYGPAAGPASAAKPTPHPTYPPVPLVVTVEDFDSDGTACRICDDGLGAYVNGFQGVTAVIDAYGNVIINFNATETPVVRKLQFDHSQPVNPANTFRPPAALNSYLSTQFHPAGSIQNMTIGTSQCIQSDILFTDHASSQMYRHNYRKTQGAPDSSQTAYLVVSRVNAETWELEPKIDPCNPTYATVAKLLSNATRGNGALTDLGNYRLPFKMTLVKQ